MCFHSVWNAYATPSHTHHTHKHRTHTCTHVHIHTTNTPHAHTPHTHHTNIRTCTHTQTVHVHTHTLARVQMHVRTHVHACTNTHKRMHARICTHTHTDTLQLHETCFCPACLNALSKLEWLEQQIHLPDKGTCPPKFIACPLLPFRLEQSILRLSGGVMP